MSNPLFDKVYEISFYEIQTPFYITFVNHNSYLFLKSFDISHFTSVGIDGFLLAKIVSAARGVSAPLSRTSFDATSIGIEFFRSNPCGFSTVVTIGGTREEAYSFAKKIRRECPSTLRVVSVSGFLHDSGFETWTAYLQTVIQQHAPDAIVIGLGSPLQEKVSKLLYEIDSSISSITCGGFISQTASVDSLHYYPRLIDYLGLRWFWRLYKEPHVARRLLFVYPRAIIRSMMDVVGTYAR